MRSHAASTLRGGLVQAQLDLPCLQVRCSDSRVANSRRLPSSRSLECAALRAVLRVVHSFLLFRDRVMAGADCVLLI